MSNFQAPEIQPGDIVLWYPQAEKVESHACAALVHRCEGSTVSMTVYKGGARPVFYPFVRHMKDPFLNEGDVAARRDSGGWELSPMLKRLHDVEAALKDLTSSKRSSSK